MYIVSVDLGSSNLKGLIMNVVGDEIELVGKKRIAGASFENFMSDILSEYHIKESDIEKIVVTGTGSSFLGGKYHDIEILKIAEFDAIAYGGLLLSKKDEGIVVSVGTGTAFVESNLSKTTHLGGTGLGGGTFVGLGKRLIREDISFVELIDQVKKGNTKNVDLTIGDINNGSIGNLTSDITAANFAGVHKKASKEDIVAGLANMIIETVALMAKQYNKRHLPVIFIGTFVTDEHVQKTFIKLSEFTKDEYIFVDNSDYAIAIGAYEYYLLRYRKP